MKTILLTLFLACFGVWAQTFPQNDPGATNDAAKEEILRRSMRAALLGGTNSAPNPAASAATNVADTVAVAQAGTTTKTVPTFPAFPTPRSRQRPPGAINPAAFAGGTNRAGVGVLGATNVNGVTATQPPPLTPGAGPIPTLPNAPAAAVAPVVTTPPPAAPQEQIIPAGLIDFPAVPLETVLPIYAELVGKTILHAQLPPVVISLKTQTALTKTEAIQALDSVLAMNNITMIPVGDKFVKAVSGPQVFSAAEQFTTHEVTELPEADQFITHIAQLKYAKPSEVVVALTPFAQIPNGFVPIDSSGILIIRDYAGNVKRMLELLKQIDVTVPLDYDSEVIPIKYALAADIASALSSLGGNTSATIGQAHTSGNTGGARPGFGSGLGTTPGQYNPSNPSGGINPGGITQPGTFGSSPGGGRTSSFSDRLNKIIKNAAGQGEFQVLGQTKIIADQRTNSLLVFAGKQDMEMIKKIISELDIVLAQVLIEAIIMEVSLNNSRDVGFSYLQGQKGSSIGNYFNGIGAVNNGTFLNKGNFIPSGTNSGPSVPGGLSYFANFGGDFTATATAVANDGRITVLSRPRVQTSHGVAATLQVGDTVPEITGTYFNGLGTSGSSSQYQQTFVGINLTVTPLINPDGLVVMDITQDIEQLGTPTTIDGNPVPTTSKRYAQATVSVRDHDTIILGGLISTTKSSTHSGVPFLKDIPGLGYLFRSSSDSTDRKELIVLIRPTVLPTPESAAMVATHERARLPGVKSAEREIQLDENQRLRDSDRIKVPKERD